MNSVTKSLVFMLVLGLFAHPALGRDLRVLTYNIHHSEGRDSVFDIERIATVIDSTNPDIVALQELDQGTDRSGRDVFQLDRLAELTGMQGYFGKARDSAGGEYGNGVLISSEIAITSTVNHPLPNPALGEPRAVIEMGLSLDEMGSTIAFTLFATHFDHASGVNRLAQAHFVNDLVATSTTPALLAGDLNAGSNSSPMQLIYQEWTNTSDPISQIDYVLYRGPHQWNVVEGGEFIINSTTEVASDHFPLLAVVEVVPEPGSLVLLSTAALALLLFVRRRR